MPKWYEFELGKAADILVKELFKLKEGETMVITADTESDERVVNATARAAFAAGGKPMVIWLASPLGVGKAADPMFPTESLAGALLGADCWVEYNNQWIFYSSVYDRVMKENKKLRYSCLVGLPRRDERRHDGEDHRQGRLSRAEGVPRQADRDSQRHR
jgi:leucyl aminopeptidase (aminopeptidase T)